MNFIFQAAGSCGKYVGSRQELLEPTNRFFGGSYKLLGSELYKNALTVLIDLTMQELSGTRFFVPSVP